MVHTAMSHLLLKVVILNMNSGCKMLTGILYWLLIQVHCIVITPTICVILSYARQAHCHR